MATFDTPSVTTPMPSTSMSFSQIASAPKLQGSMTSVTPPVDTTPIELAKSGTAEQIAREQAASLQGTNEAKINTAISDYVQKYLGLSGTPSVDEQKAQEQAALNAQYDISGTTSKLSELATKMNALPLQTEAEKRAILASPIGGITSADLSGREQEITRKNDITRLNLAAESLVLQGKLDSANLAIKNAIDAKYGPQEARYKSILEFNTLNEKALGRKAEEMKSLAEAKLKDLAEKKSNEEAVQKMIIEATPNAPASIIANAKKIAERGGSKVAVAQALGKYGGDYLGDLVKWSTINKNKADYDKTMAEIKALKTPIQNLAPVGTQAHSTNSWVASAQNKESLSAGEREKINKSFSVVGQLGNLATALQKDQTSFFGGKVREIKAALGADADAGAIQAQITALVPQVARGIYGEVGVLTNVDTANYKKVIGNLSSPNAQNKAVTALTLTALRNGVKSQLDTAAASKLDVSRFVPMYQDLTNQINKINDEIGVSDQIVKEYVDKNPQTRQMVEKMVVDGRSGSEILQVLGVEN